MKYHQLQVRKYGISLYLQGTPAKKGVIVSLPRYIPVPTGNSLRHTCYVNQFSVYPCTYRELSSLWSIPSIESGISLYLQGTLAIMELQWPFRRYIPVPTGNSLKALFIYFYHPVYPCTYRELDCW